MGKICDSDTLSYNRTHNAQAFPTIHQPFQGDDLQEGMEPLTLREIFIAEAGNAIRDKPDWWNKFKDDAIWEKWMEELQPLAPNEEITKAMNQYLRDELAYLAEDRNAEDGIDKGLDMTYKSDKLIPQSLKEDLLVAVKPLEDVPEHMKDWHPNSGNQVLDLVHPSLYPVVSGRTYLKSADGNSSLIDLKRPGTNDTWLYSEKFQWLPTDFSIDPTTKTVKFESYINNLHPIRHKKLYIVLGKLLSACLPMFDRVLFDMRYPPKQRIECDSGNYWYEDSREEGDNEVEESENKMETSDQEDDNNEDNDEAEDEEESDHTEDEQVEGQEIQEEGSEHNEDDEGEGDAQEGEGEDESEGDDNDDNSDHDDNDDDNDDESIESYFLNRTLIVPDADKFVPPEKSFRSYIPELGDPDTKMRDAYYDPKPSMKATLSEFGRGQVIVKLANIELTPENPNYPGGGWHLEGMLNERIAATVIYYYDSENVTDNHLAFRQSVYALEEYEQNDVRGFREIFGLGRDKPSIQNLGYIVTKQDRVIAFPNLYQHKVSPFSLVDKTKPGHRKICVFFLIDPGVPIISTSQVGPQQEQWWKEEMYKSGFTQNLPPELVNIIFKYVEPMTLEEAKEVRLKLMEERGLFIKTQNSETFAREFSLCEH